MQEAQGACTFFLFCGWEMGGQGSQRGVGGEGNEALDNMLPTGQMLQAVREPIPK